MASISINNKLFTFSTKTTFLVKDTFVELNKTPSMIFYQKELGIAPTGLQTNVLYYNWQPDTIMTIITGVVDGVEYELYWIYSYIRTISIFTSNDLSAINQSMVKTFKYGSNDDVIFNDTKHQQLSILAEAGSVVEPAGELELHHYNYAVFDGNQYLDTGVYFKEGYAVECVAKVYPHTGYIFGFEDGVYNCSLQTVKYSDDALGVSFVRPNSYSHVDYEMHTTEGMLFLQPGLSTQNVIYGDGGIGYNQFNLGFTGTSPLTTTLGGVNMEGAIGRLFIGKISKFVIQDQLNNRKPVYQAIPASRGATFGFHVRKRVDGGFYLEEFIQVDGLTCEALNDNLKF